MVEKFGAKAKHPPTPRRGGEVLALRVWTYGVSHRFRRCGEVNLPQHNWTLGQTAPAPDAPPVVHPALRPYLPLGAISVVAGF